jgi:phosphatidylglycerophosphatase A
LQRTSFAGKTRFWNDTSQENTMKHSWSGYIATWFGAGNAPVAGGTWGTLAALPLGYILHITYGVTALWVAAALSFVVGVVVSNRYMAEQCTTHDPKEVVIDEVCGMWMVLAFVPPTWLGYAVAFALFRLFDIVKPWPISWVDKHVKGGFGVMVDDVLAALLAIAVVMVAAHMGITIE